MGRVSGWRMMSQLSPPVYVNMPTWGGVDAVDVLLVIRKNWFRGGTETWGVAKV